jgi:SAM-dependent methyltransferase
MNERPTETRTWHELLERASAPYRSAGRFAWHFARGKLGYDPVFRHLLATGLIAPGARVLDIGCGQGLLASLLRACSELGKRGEWPQQWPAAPGGARVTGIELMERDIVRARSALGEGQDTRFVCGDMRRVDFPECDAVVILDVLHYVTIAEQDAVLQRVRDALVPGGRLLLRVGDAQARAGFAISQWVDRVVTRVRGHGVPPVYGRPLPEWIARLRSLGMQVQARPMSAGTPFANVLLVAQRP